MKTERGQRSKWQAQHWIQNLSVAALVSILSFAGCGTDMPAGDPLPGPEGAMGEKGDKGDPGASPFELQGDTAFYDAGNVGIGTDSPDCKLEVVGGFCTDAFKLGANPTDSYVLKSDAEGNGAWQADGLALPFAATVSDAGPLFDLTNTGDGGAASFAIDNAASVSNALEARNNSDALTGAAVLAFRGTSSLTLSDSQGVLGENNIGFGVAGLSDTSKGVYGASHQNDGIYGVSTTGNFAGVHGVNDVVNGLGLLGESVLGAGLEARSAFSNAARFKTTILGTTATAVTVEQIGKGRALSVKTTNLDANNPAVDIAQAGQSSALIAAITNNGSVSPIAELSSTGIGSGLNITLTNASNGARGLDVMQAGVGPGVFATSAGGNAVWGITSSISAAGVIGDNTFGEAVVGRSRGETGVGAVVGRNDGEGGYGVRGFVTDTNAIGVLGQSGISGGLNRAGRFENVNAANTNDVVQISSNNATSIGLRVSTLNSAGSAARFQGNVTVTGNLSKGGGSFKIDHPLDPENKYLYHSFVESPDMMNVYNGNQMLDAAGEAWITLPEWFEALNGDYRYQLTAIGAPGPNLYVAQEITGNKFKIAGGSPGMKVSWQVTGVRHDAYAMKHRIPVEEEKAAADKGTYLHPDSYAQPEARGEAFETASEVSQNLARGIGRPTLASEQDLPSTNTTNTQE